MADDGAEDVLSAGDTIADEATEGNKPPQWVIDIIKYAATDPWGFVTTLFLYLSPLFFISAILAWRLSQMIDAKEKGEKKAKIKSKNRKNVRRKQD